MAFLGSLFGRGKDIELEDLTTPEAKQSQALLQQLATTGSGAGINLGQSYGGQLFDPTMTGAEKQGISQLQGLFGGQDITKARETFTGLADTGGAEISDEYIRMMKRARGKMGSALERESAITGSRYGTAIAGKKGELDESFLDMMGVKGQELAMQQKSQQLAGAQGLAGLFGQQAGAAGQLTQIGGLERQLKNQELQAKLQEFQRQRGETLARVDLLGQEASRNPYMGVSSLPGSPSAFSGLVNTVLGGVGKGVGAGLGKKISEGGLKSIFS